MDDWTDGLLRASKPYATCGLIIADGKVVAAPPMLAWAYGKAVADVTYRLRHRGWTVSWTTGTDQWGTD